MWTARTKDIDFKIGHLGGGITLFPYQLALGISFRYWHCVFAPALRIYFGPIKVWLYWSFKK